MNFTPNTFELKPNAPDSKTTGWNGRRLLLLALFLALGSFAANATTLTINNSGCQPIKVYKVIFFSEFYQTTLNPSESHNALALLGEKWVYRNTGGSLLGSYTVPLGLFLTDNFNSGGGPSAPVVGTVAQPNCSVSAGSVTLNGLPSSGTWTLTQNPGGTTIIGTGTSKTITGLNGGTYTYTVKNDFCTSSASASVVINASPSTTSAPALTTLTATNNCPNTYVNLTVLAPVFMPSGFVITWHTSTPATAANKVANPSNVAAGTYYAAYYNAGGNCYGAAKTTKVTAVVGNCNNLVRNKNRTLNGTMNNLTNSATTEYGAAGNAFARELPADYADGISALAGPNRPNPRAISNKLSAEREDIHNDRDMAGIFYSWGQFIDHDMTANQTNSAEPANIALPSSENYFTNPISFNRSKAHPGTGVTTPREQTNTNTAWLDASQVYARTEANANWLRTGYFGKMKTSTGNMLPFNTITGEYDSPIDPTAPRMDDDQGGTKKTFVAGDNRVAEHPVLTSLHTLFVREHNRLCDQFVAQGMINDEEIYQKARKYIGALIQQITYSQWMTAMGIQLKPYTGYNPNVNPDILNLFSTAAYRWHTMVENDIIFRDNECQGVGPVELPLKDVFFNIDIVRNYDIGVLLKGISVHRQYETDLKVNNGLRNFLGGSFGTDLVSINIQRGRDHGLPSYNVVRQYYTGTAASSFSDITTEDTTAQKMQQLYGSVDNVDLWVGLFAEPHLPGKSIGKTLNAIITSQFEKLRDGDYYFFQNDPELAAYLGNIQSTKLGDVISRNSAANNFQDNVFFRKHCSSEGDDIAHHPCNVQPNFEGWTYLGKSGSKNYFKWNGGNLNFADAYEMTVRIGGHLPQMANSTEVNYVKSLMPSGSTCWLDMVRNSNSWTRNPLFNLSDVLQPGVPVSYFNWKFGEPNNSGGGENRVQMYSDGKWNDVAHTALHPVYAEVECNGNSPCVAGIAAPSLTNTYKANVCPATTVSLAGITASNKPGNVTLTWHTGAVPTNSNKIANVTAMANGTYYAAFYSASNNCYSSKTAAFNVTVNVCDPCSANNYSIDCEKNINNGGWSNVPDCIVSVCPGEKVYLSVNPNGYPTSWTGPNGFTANTNDILVGNTVALANAGNYVATVNVNGCIKSKTITLQVTDADGDGVCDNNDCQPNNPAFPATPGTACNDNNANTTNDVVTANGCGCAGTPANNNPDCANITITGTATGVTVNGLNGAPISSLQIFTTSWQQQYSCFANCGASQTVNLPAGSYLVYAKYYTAGYALICEKQVTVTVGGNVGPCAGLGGDTDGDGVCDNNDCQPNNPAYPATPGTACNDGNPNTTNDVITANGCGCAGTPVAPVCDNFTNGGAIGFGNTCTTTYAYCSSNGSPQAIGNCTAPSGGTGAIETIWLRSTSSCVPPTTTAAQVMAGQDPHWKLINGATALTYTVPDTVSTNTCYLRCTRRASCPNFLESNIISLTIQPNCGGGNGTPNCANISIAPGNGSITVGGLGGAPVVSVQIFSSTWQQLYNCFGNCGSSTATYPVPAGSYFVYVKYYTAGYQLVCENNQTVNVTSNLLGSSIASLQFDAIKYLEHTQMVWKYNADKNVEEYILERSADGVNFEEISFLPSEKSNSANLYEAYDLEPLKGDNYYRLKLMNVDNSITYSEAKLLVFEEMVAYQIFPNPANGFASVNLEKVVGKAADIHIYNNSGIRMKEFHLDEVYGKYYQMDLRDLHEGHYFVWINVPGKRPVAMPLVIGRI